ncbi:MAG: hypothetical protein P4L55_09115 [Syntrophobacteraceae bacterium]|nr:hypothetical protein [Syntrophobacteraceae bacterium]
MIIDKMLKIGLLIGAVLVAVLAVSFFGRPLLVIGLVLLGALVELGLGQYGLIPKSATIPAIMTKSNGAYIGCEEKKHADRK